MRRNLLNKIKDEKGQSLVEFALILVLLLLLLLGIVEFARGWFRADLLKGAANIAARTYAVTSDTDPDVKAAAARAAARTVIPTLTDADIVPDTTTPGQVMVTVREDFQTVLYGILPMMNTITISRDATYRLEN